MAAHAGAERLERHWNQQFLPNNHWLAATDERLVASSPSLDVVIAEALSRYTLDPVSFAFVTFDLWQ